mgnify:CR=1 FL=1
MRAVVQRVKEAKVIVAGEIKGQIGKGLLIYLGVDNNDDINDVKYMVEKIINLRIFEDKEQKMNLSLLDVKGELLVVSQFTLMGDCRKGRRPSFTAAGNPKKAEKLYNKFAEYCGEKNIRVETGVFQANMMVNSINRGPVTMLVDSKKTF